MADAPAPNQLKRTLWGVVILLWCVLGLWVAWFSPRQEYTRRLNPDLYAVGVRHWERQPAEDDTGTRMVITLICLASGAAAIRLFRPKSPKT